MDEVVMKEITKAHSGAACKGMTVTPFGDVLSLYQQINFGNIHQKANELENGKISSLGILDERGKKVDFSDYKDILSNDDSSLLLLISSTQIGMVEVSPEYFKRGYLASDDDKGNKLPDCVFRTVIDCALEKKPGMKIIKACFHPYNKYAIMILFQSDVFMVYDVRTHESVRHSLPANMQFVSFCSGPDVDWLRFSVFLTNNQGDIYALCPIIPHGTIISLTILEELWNWTDNQREFWIGSDRDPNDKLRLEYVNILEAFLCELFGDIDTILKDFSDLKNKDDEFVMAGEGKVSSSNILFKRAVCIADYHVVVQGPLTLQQGKVKDPRGINPNDRSVILDVCAPRVSATSLVSGSGSNNANTSSAEDAAPLIAAVHATGFVELLLFDYVDDRMGFIAPRFECLDTREKVFAFPAPALLQADTFTAAASFTNAQSNRSGEIDWQLRADPVYAHYFYLLNKTEGNVYILSSSWLKNMLNEVTESVRRAELMAQQASLTWHGEEEFDGSTSNELFSNAKRGTAPNPTNSASVAKQAAAELSLCLPMFEPPAENNAGIHLLSMVVYYDVYLGHVALLLLSSGQLVAINVSVHTKLCALHTHLSQLSDEANTAREKSLALLPETLRKDLQEYHVPYRTAQVLLTKIEEGLQKIPTLEVTVESEEDRLRGAPPSAADARKLLASVSAHIETAVLVPLKRLHDNTLFHCDLVRDMAQVQHDLIHGSATKSGNENNFPGIKNLLREMEGKQHALKDRIAKIQQRDEYLRDQLQSYLELTCNLPRPLTRAEKVYQRQLHQWLQQIRAMNEEVALLKMKTDKRRFVQHHEQLLHQQQEQQRLQSQQLPPPPQPTASSAVRGTTPFFKASSASFLSSTSNSSFNGNKYHQQQLQNASLDVSSVSVLNTPWTASRPAVGSSTTSKQVPMTPPSASSSTASSTVLFSPTNNHTTSGMYYYHPEAIRYPPTSSFTSPMAVSATSASAADSAVAVVPPINAPVSIPELTEEEIAVVHASLEEIGQTLVQARKHVEGTLKDVKHQQRLQQRAANQS